MEGAISTTDFWQGRSAIVYRLTSHWRHVVHVYIQRCDGHGSSIHRAHVSSNSSSVEGFEYFRTVHFKRSSRARIMVGKAKWLYILLPDEDDIPKERTCTRENDINRTGKR